MTVARIGEFAWHNMEPQEGNFQFDWLHRVIDRLQAADIRVVLGTPSATPPMWLEEMDPGMHTIDELGLPSLHGGRRHCCSNNATYDHYSLRIAEKMAEEFGHHPNVIGWQIDNEIYLQGAGCFCPTCINKFHRWLEKRYTTIDNLNRAWNLSLFSQWYDTFDQIPAPARSWQSPHLRLEWLLFQGQSHIDFVARQAAALKKHTERLVGTDVMDTLGLDFEKVADSIDVFQFNHYNEPKNLWRANFWFDMMRELKDQPFWNTETATSWNGHIVISQSVKPDGYCRVNSWLPIVLGAEANMYWLWRQHWAGHELTHGSVLYANGRPMHIFGEVQQTAAEFDRAADFVRDTRVCTDVALHYSTLNFYMMDTQPLVPESPDPRASLPLKPFLQRLYDHFYEPIIDYGLRPAVIGARKALTDYKLLVTACMLTLEENDLPERIEQWVKDGGVWIVGPMTDTRTAHGTHYKDRGMGITERMTGAQLIGQFPDRVDHFSAAWQDGTPFTCGNWMQLYDVPADAEVLATVTGGYSATVGKAVAFKKRVGKGCVIVVGTLPSAEDFTRILALAQAESGVQRIETSGGITVAERRGNGRSGLMLVDHNGEGGSCKISGTMTDLLTGTVYTDTVPLAPYDVKILERLP